MELQASHLVDRVLGAWADAILTESGLREICGPLNLHALVNYLRV
jgi:hypothetical protein